MEGWGDSTLSFANLPPSEVAWVKWGPSYHDPRHLGGWETQFCPP